MLDDARHFFGKEVVKAFLDRMVEHKFNIFHWHLVDDQGWRIEIRKHPELVEYGAKRPCSVKYGTHPSWPDGKLHFELNNEPYGPFYYTQDDIREILAYAKERHITVVPEIELPGHVRAMLAAHPEYSCVGEKLPRTPRVYWSIEDEVLCAGNDGGIKLLEEIFDEVCELFPDSPVIHIGGDEAPRDRWKVCPHCQKRIKEEGLKDENQLQSYFMERIEKWLNERGRSIIGWDEILKGGISKSATVMSWRGTKGGIAAAKLGNNVIMAPNTYCYIDYYQTSNHKENNEPLGNGRKPVTLRKAYSLDPYEGLNKEQQQYIKGVQMNLWTEYIATFAHAQHMILPRIAALAEIGWSYGNKDYDDFSRRMHLLRNVYDKQGFVYAPYFFEGVE